MKLPQQSKIRWQRSDYITLGKAVSQFNKKINKLQQEENKNYLPDTINYKEIKENITTRKELNRVINSLRRFKKEGAEELYTLESGEQITKWEKHEIVLQRNIAEKRLKEELQQLNEPEYSGKFSRVQMGSEEARRIEATLESIKKLESKKGYEFERLKNRIKYIGTSDYTLKKAYIYRENFMKELEDLKDNTPEFQKVYEYFKNINNPITFFNTTQKSQVLQDFFVWYKNPETYAGFDSNSELVDYIFEEYS